MAKTLISCSHLKSVNLPASDSREIWDPSASINLSGLSASTPAKAWPKFRAPPWHFSPFSSGSRIKSHGITVPLFSLHTKKGPATYLDLIPLIDWCKKIGFDALQLLPLYDTGPNESPYSPISSLALHPKYLDPKTLPTLPALQALKPYALFKALKVKFNQAPFQSWPKNHQGYSDTLYEQYQKLAEPFLQLQANCFAQMRAVKEHASRQNISLIGDIPILIDPNSADVWAEPKLFDLTHKVGAPPDAYNEKGQLWGFPLPNFEEMKNQQNSWWKTRLKLAEECFHMYRIDHVVGLFRLFATDEKGKSSFFPSDPTAQEKRGRDLLQTFLSATSMKPIAEDLGSIPDFVYQTLKALQIPGTKVMRWQHSLPLNQYEPLSLTTLSTHDMDLTESWWRNSPQESIPFAHLLHIPYHPILSKEEKFKILKASHATTSLFHINLLQEYLTLIDDFTSPNPDEERINWPGTTKGENWSYRFKPTLEEITSNRELQEKLRALLN